MTSVPPPGTGYFVEPSTGPGPGVLLLHSSWGLTDDVRAIAHKLADSGFSVLAPDLADGETATTSDHAHELLVAADMNVTASLVQSSLRLLRSATADPQAAVGVVGYSSGASWALWLSDRRAEFCRSVVAYYGTQSIEFSESSASYLLHFASEDDVVTNDDQALLGLNLQMARRPFQVELHDGVGHGFAEATHEGFSPTHEAVAWRQTLEFLANDLRPHGD